ncbi:sialate O-acetylesterase [Flavobacterium aquidurense]|uniref:9-O-acetylesterase n=1 Tax=Flavobacterium frigidimaris TaxID=262320 RepID=A0ABX4BJT0_FLAFR|nr:sialate O-acetylesterase [Flavobacterium frigidimaris]OXA75175.1 9-O-acetylesterase [Flavobacterium frigidimaris]SDZ66666.1 sialate O-acetylesterase [Flavobacterium aquidurense]
MIYLKNICFLLLVLGFKLTLCAQVKLPALVADNMVLQQNSKVNLWGWASPNEKINIQLGWQNTSIDVLANADGNWKISVDTPQGSDKPYTISIQASNKIVLNNVLIGEIWICSGQSNMYFPVGKEDGTWKTGVKNYEEELKNASYPNIRLFTVATNASPRPLDDVNGSWKECSPTNVYTFSAVAYFFGRELYQKLKVPIGLISTSWGGTKAEAWTAQNILEENTDFLPILEQDAKNEKLYQEKLETYYLNVKNERIANANDLSKIQLKKPKKEANKTSFVLYNAMLHPITNYTMKGVIWYQGESNAEKAFLYRSLFPAMVKSWRDEWKQGDFPFYYVQIAPHKGQNPDIREAQLIASKTISNAGMVVTTDVGNATNIHPIDKQTVGYRLGLIARAKTYGEDKLVFSGPLYNHLKIKKDKIQLFFDDVDSGFKKPSDDLKEFEIAGSDQVFYPAQAKIDGKTILVSSSKVKNPAAVRFAWKAVPEPNLFNSENLPASPFRTDDWEVGVQKK